MSTSKPSPRLSESLLVRLGEIVGRDRILTDPADCLPYGYDNSRRQALPQCVVFAAAEREICDIVGICSAVELPIVARGRGTGTTGATVPDRGGVVLSLERMTRIIAIDPANRVARVEPGVTNQSLQDALKPHGFFWPPDPTSAAACTIGGNLAYNSAGPRAVKYGTPRENTLGLRFVTGLGEPVRTGVYTTKGVVGYDLTRLLIGSEGTLGIITEALVKLTPLPTAKRTLRASYRDIHSAARAVCAIMAQPLTPCALEFMDHGSLEMVKGFAGLDTPPGTGAMLMIETDGTPTGAEEGAIAVAEAADVDGLLELRRAATPELVEALWKTRKALSPALRNIAPKKINEDVVVPVSRIPDLIEGLDALSSDSGIRIVNFGHAGNGNIHVNLLLDPEDPDQRRRADTCLARVFDLVLALEGTLSGEHGVGLEKRDFVGREIDPEALRLMHAIKRQFDPKGILNPGKALPEPTSAGHPELLSKGRPSGA